MPIRTPRKFCLECNTQLSRRAIYNKTAKWCRPCFATVRTGKKRLNFIPWNKGIKVSKEISIKNSFAMKKRWERARSDGRNTILESGVHPNLGKPSEQIGRKRTEETRLLMSSVALSGFKNGRKPNIVRNYGNKSRTGMKPWNWKEDRSLLVKKQERNDPAYAEWRKQVWLRDNFACKIVNPDCAGRIEAHHILGWSNYPDLRYEVNNGITLCHFHHPRKRNDEMRLSPYFQSLIQSEVN